MENEVKQCPSWCTHGVHGLHSVGCPNKYPAPSSPPVQEPPLLTFAEAMEALAAEKLVEVSHGGESPRWERMLFGSTWTTAEVARYAKYRYRLKPARALGRARELVAEAAAAYSNQPDSRAFREVVDIVERAVGEVLDRMDAKLLGPSECSRQLRAEFLAPASLPRTRTDDDSHHLACGVDGRQVPAVLRSRVRLVLALAAMGDVPRLGRERILMICKACSGWRLPGRGRPLSQAGADNIGMDHRKQCFCATPAVREQCPSSTKGEADREVPETGSGS